MKQKKKGVIMNRDYRKISQEDVKRLYPQYVNEPYFMVRKGIAEIVYLVSVERECDGLLISQNRIKDTVWQVLLANNIPYSNIVFRGKNWDTANIVRALNLHNLILGKRGDDNYSMIIDQLSGTIPLVDTIDKVRGLIDLDRKRFPVNPNRPDEFLEICGEIISQNSLARMLLGGGNTVKFALILLDLLTSNKTTEQICLAHFSRDVTFANQYKSWLFELL